MSIIWLILNAFLFVIGVAIIPLLAFGLRGIVPRFLAEPIASGILWLVVMARGPSRLVLNADDEYVMVRGDPSEIGPRRHWGRFLGQPLSLDYIRDEAAFGDIAEDVNVREHDPDDDISSERVERSRLEANRGGFGTFVELLDDAERYVYVRVGELLTQLRGQAASSGAYRATREGAREFGGDTSTSSQTFRFVSFTVMLVLGVGTGYLFFF